MFPRGLRRLLGLAILAGCSVAQPAPTRDAAASNDELWRQLRDGTGYVVMVRHTSTEPGTGDPPGFALTDCATQRNLSPEGREEARRLGARFRERGVPVEAVASSRYCRCLETAQLLGLGPVTPRTELDSLFDSGRPEADPRTERVRELIAARWDEPGVLVLVTHQTNIAGVSGIWPRPGDAVVVRIDPKSAPTVAVLPSGR